MNEKGKLLPARSLVLGIVVFLATLLMAHYQGLDLTLAKVSNQGKHDGTYPATVNQTDATMLANCRYGITAGYSDAHIIPHIGSGVFYRFSHIWNGPLPENNPELLRMIRTRQRKTTTGEYLPEWYTNIPLNEDLAEIIRSAPNSVWIIGNEIERGPNPGETWSARTDDIFADVYVEAYHDIYHFIKGIDPTARIANAGLIQITPMRLQYLDMMWDAYLQKYGVPMPVDIWTIHTYVLPELTPTGQPNNIASAALGADLALGKRWSGGDASKCPDPDVYCYAEHDDPSILEEQLLAMRQWMKDRGQQEKPLVVTEFSTLYHYIVEEDGRCGGLFDEFGKCLTPKRVSAFMLNAFDYFNNARDLELGMPADENRLVQQWIWFGAFNWSIGTSNLLQDDRQTLTMMGETFRDHVFVEPTHVNLVVDTVSGIVVSQDENEKATAQLSVNFRNNGNISIEKPFTVALYQDAALTQPIISTRVTQNIRGCATGTYSAELDWEGLSMGTHQFWIKLDSDNEISEADESDNLDSGQLTVTGSVNTLDVKIISNGEGSGGTVSVVPTGPTYPEGTIVSLTAVPYSGWNFSGWKGAIVDSAPQLSVNMIDDISVEAHFEQDHYDLVIDVIGEGNITLSPRQDHYLYGDLVTLLAKPAPGWRFVEWRGDIDTSIPMIEHLFESDVSITAVFEILLPTVSHSVYYPLSMGDSSTKH